MKSQNNKPKFKMSKKQIIISIISLLIIVGITVPIIVFSIPKDPIINDLTDNTPEAEDVLSEGVVDNHAEAILSPNISLYDVEESKTIESSILSVSQVDTNLVLDVNKGSPMESLEKGDVFFIQGTTDSFLGEAYFGKVSSKIEQDGYYTYAIETPMIDEVFDYIDIDYSQDMSYSNISNIETPEGVTVSAVDDLSAEFNMNSGVIQTGSFSNTNITLLSSTESKEPYDFNIDSDGNICVNFSIDILKWLTNMGVVSSDKNNFDDESTKYEEEEIISVYYTNTGVCYHRSYCKCLSKSKYETTLDKAIALGKRACKICTPPTKYDSNITNADADLILSGKIGLQDLAFSIMSEGDAWTIEKGFENLSLKTEGTFFAQSNLTGNFELDFSGDDTKILIGGKDSQTSIITLEGLEEKLFPLAFISWDGKWDVQFGIESDTINAPLTVGLMLYTDIYGNITAGVDLSCAYSLSVENNFDVFKEGKFLGLGTEKKDNEENASKVFHELAWSASAEVKADVDFQMLGGSVMLYVGNMNVLELSLVRFGAEAQGTIGFDASWETGGDLEVDTFAEGNVCVYVEFLELDLKVKAKSKWGINGTVEENLGPLHRIDLFKTGNIDEKSTHFNSSTMYVNNIVAQDSETLYYKGENGNLIAEKDSYKTTIYAEDFFVICGIDDSYIYILRQSESNSSLYDMYRIQKDGTSERRIVEGIKNFMECDESYFYYTFGDDTYTIVRFDRSTLEEKEIASFDAEVVYANKQNDNLYVETKGGWLFLTTIKYYLIDQEGKIIESYGENPSVSNLVLEEFNEFYVATKIFSSGFLRDTASEIYWLSKDKSKHIKAETTNDTGWNESNDAGIFACRNGEISNYSLVLYRATDGELITVTDINNKLALFSITQDKYGMWYFIDETETGFAIYTMNENFDNKRIIAELSYEDFPVNLETCGMILIDDTIWFYEMPNEYTANVLYRYSLY